MMPLMPRDVMDGVRCDMITRHPCVRCDMMSDMGDVM